MNMKTVIVTVLLALSSFAMAQDDATPASDTTMDQGSGSEDAGQGSADTTMDQSGDSAAAAQSADDSKVMIK